MKYLSRNVVQRNRSSPTNKPIDCRSRLRYIKERLILSYQLSNEGAFSATTAAMEERRSPPHTELAQTSHTELEQNFPLNVLRAKTSLRKPQPQLRM